MARKKARDISELASVVSNTPIVETAFNNPFDEQALPPTAIDSALSPEEYQGTPKKKIKVVEEVPSESIPVEDRVNNQGSKELAMSKAGVTRRRTYEVICELLTAVKVEVYYDYQGKECVRELPDLDKRRQGAELALKAFGDLKEMKDVSGQVTYNTVVYQWKK